MMVRLQIFLRPDLLLFFVEPQEIVAEKCQKHRICELTKKEQGKLKFSEKICGLDDKNS